MKRFKVEHNDWETPTMYITLHNPPYDHETVLSRTKWKVKECTITEMKQYSFEEDE